MFLEVKYDLNTFANVLLCLSFDKNKVLFPIDNIILKDAVKPSIYPSSFHKNKDQNLLLIYD